MYRRNSRYRRGSRGIFEIGISENPPRLKGLKTPRRLISRLEPLGAQIGVRILAPERLCNNDLLWLEIPIANDDIGGDFIPKHYAKPILTSWMSQEMAAHNLTNNVTVISKHAKGVPGNGPFCGQDQQKLSPSYKRGSKKIAKRGDSKIPVYEYYGGNLSGELERRSPAEGGPSAA